MDSALAYFGKPCKHKTPFQNPTADRHLKGVYKLCETPTVLGSGCKFSY